MKTIGEQIKARRTELGLSMEQLGSRIGVTWQTVQHWENDTTTPKRVRWAAVSQALGIPINDLFLGGLATPEPATPVSDHSAPDWTSISQQAREVAMAWDALPAAVRDELHARILHQWAVMQLASATKGKIPNVNTPNS